MQHPPGLGKMRPTLHQREKQLAPMCPTESALLTALNVKIYTSKVNLEITMPLWEPQSLYQGIAPFQC